MSAMPTWQDTQIAKAQMQDHQVDPNIGYISLMNGYPAVDNPSFQIFPEMALDLNIGYTSTTAIFSMAKSREKMVTKHQVFRKERQQGPEFDNPSKSEWMHMNSPNFMAVPRIFSPKSPATPGIPPAQGSPHLPALPALVPPAEGSRVMLGMGNYPQVLSSGSAKTRLFKR